MNAKEIYIAKANDIYAALGHAHLEHKQINERIENLEMQLKSLVEFEPLLLKVEQDDSSGEE